MGGAERENDIARVGGGGAKRGETSRGSVRLAADATISSSFPGCGRSEVEAHIHTYTESIGIRTSSALYTLKKASKLSVAGAGGRSAINVVSTFVEFGLFAVAVPQYTRHFHCTHSTGAPHAPVYVRTRYI